MNNNDEQKMICIVDKLITTVEQQDRELAYLRSEIFRLRLSVSELTEFKNKIVRQL